MNIFKFFIISGFILFILLLLIDIYISISTNKKIYQDIKLLPDITIAVVLGTAKYYQGHINGFYQTRIEIAAYLYHHKKIKKILVTGAKHNESYNEAYDMQQDLIHLGVAKADIILDEAGFRTLDSIYRAEKVFGFNQYILISQPFHLQRALYISQFYQQNNIGFIAKNPANIVSRMKIRLREVVARVRVLLDLYIFKTKPSVLD